MSARCFAPSPLTLGTAQLGLAYGVANATGLPDEAEAWAILDAAAQGGVTSLDTARAYGVAEARIGRWLAGRPGPALRIVTKLPALPEAAAQARGDCLENGLAASLQALGRQRLDLLMMHRGEDLLDGRVAARLEAALADGRIAAYGASVYDPAIALRLLETVPIAALQVPASIVDRRFRMAGVLDRAQTAGVRVFARSAFLQGALLMAPAALPPHLAALGPTAAALDRLARDAGMTLAALALVALRDTPGVASVVVGVERAAQLPPHLAALRLPPLPDGLDAEIARIAEGLPAAVLDPSRWPR